MLSVRAKVRNGRLVLDEPTDLPEGAEVELVPVGDDWDDMDSEQRLALERELVTAAEDIKHGRLVDGDVVIAELRARRT